ncbi:MAG: MAPEG family protein [Gammaproteobacteria bacterium]|nr:MAPEG family protein [Gammaproteobacteria bacterium]MDH3767941.1 MAPEG family protein [Gammaproteobacteria bacterium]
MAQTAIFVPFLGVMFLSFLVWTYMYVRRLHFFHVNQVDPQSFATRASAMSAAPDALQNPSNNLQNLFELPVLFYALCLYLYSVGQVDEPHVICAYLFLGFRAVHSLIHCTVNKVIWRFLTYAAAAIALWTMVVRSVLNLWMGSA